LGPPSEEELREREGTVAPPPQGARPAATTFSSEQIALLTDIIRKAQQVSVGHMQAPAAKSDEAKGTCEGQKSGHS
jgi:hypothetical protein